MTKAEFKSRLRSIGWTQRDFAGYFRLPENTVSRWGLAGQVETFPPWVEPALSLIEAAKKHEGRYPAE